MFEKELRQLEEQHREELRNLRHNYRLAVRSVSPERMIRKHPAISLGSAALAGVLIAPAWGKSKVREEKRRQGRGWLGSLLRVAMRKMKGAKVGGGASSLGASNGHAKGLPEALTQVLEKVGSVMMVFNSLGRSISRNMPMPESGQRAEFSVADAGTVNLGGGEGAGGAGKWTEQVKTPEAVEI